jgi:hypothetical protein
VARESPVGAGSVLSVQSLSSASSFINQDFAIHLIVLGAITMVAATSSESHGAREPGRAVEREKSCTIW